MLVQVVPHSVHALRNHLSFSWQDYLILIPWLLYLGCAWGIVRWRQWGQIGAAVLSILELAVVVVMAILYGPLILDLNILLWSGVNCAIVIWLVLPEVRLGYSRRAQAA